MAELTLEQSIQQILPTLPAPIQKFFVQNKLGGIVRTLMERYALHVDQGAILEREILSALLGIKGPDEIAEALYAELPISKQTVLDIITDLNKEVFVPLRKEEEKGVAVEPQIQTALPKVEPQNGSHFKLENKIPLPRPVPQLQKNVPPSTISKGVLPPKEFLPRSSTLGDVVRSVLAAPKPVDNSKLLENHEEPHIELNKADVPVNLPGVMLEPVILEAPIPEVQPSPILKVEPQMQKSVLLNTLSDKVSGEHSASQNVIAVAPIEPKSVPDPITSYSSDPYREPIDEPPTE